MCDTCENEYEKLAEDCKNLEEENASLLAINDAIMNTIRETLYLLSESNKLNQQLSSDYQTLVRKVHYANKQN